MLNEPDEQEAFWNLCNEYSKLMGAVDQFQRERSFVLHLLDRLAAKEAEIAALKALRNGGKDE